ncbi:MAG TPA: hypothetical protein VMU84_09800 [Thermoanaerobaculia bacterium]|nr:hypothetical protein [Thermoanaerobaculia bacterium]
MPELAKHHRDYSNRDADRPFSVSHFFHVLRAYSPVIRLGMLSVVIAYMLVAVLVFLMGPGQRITKVVFRLDFQGSPEGKYPNGLKFNPADIVSPPILHRVFVQNKLERYTTQSEFGRSLVVLESNRAYELLALEYQARLADPKLSPVDRERIETEFEAKRGSLAKNDYALIYSTPINESKLPKTVREKVMSDILKEWADYATRERRVLKYRVAIISPSTFQQSVLNQKDYVIAVQLLRSNMYRLIGNIVELRNIPIADVAQTKDNLSLIDVQAKLDDIVRFRLEPLVPLIRANNLIKNPEMTIRFVEAQLAYDKRTYEAKQEAAKSVREALLAYDPTASVPSEAGALTGARSIQSSGAAGAETVMPQINESFIDRLIRLSKQAADTEYRQKMIDTLMQTSNAVVPWQQAVRYDEDLLVQLRSNSAGGTGTITAQEVEQQIRDAEADSRTLLQKTTELYDIISESLNPGSEIYTVTSVPITRTERLVALPQLAMWGVVVVLVAFPLILAACLIHNRVREEEEEEALAD